MVRAGRYEQAACGQGPRRGAGDSRPVWPCLAAGPAADAQTRYNGVPVPQWHGRSRRLLGALAGRTRRLPAGALRACSSMDRMEVSEASDTGSIPVGRATHESGYRVKPGQFQVTRCGMKGIEAATADTAHSFGRHTHDQYGIGVLFKTAASAWCTVVQNTLERPTCLGLRACAPMDEPPERRIRHPSGHAPCADRRRDPARRRR